MEIHGVVESARLGSGNEFAKGDWVSVRWEWRRIGSQEDSWLPVGYEFTGTVVDGRRDGQFSVPGIFVIPDKDRPEGHDYATSATGFVQLGQYIKRLGDGTEILTRFVVEPLQLEYPDAELASHSDSL